MSRIWLKCIVLDPESKDVIDRWEDHPLPETLQIKHLRSYLEQRFGEPLETDVGMPRASRSGLRAARRPKVPCCLRFH